MSSRADSPSTASRRETLGGEQMPGKAVLVCLVGIDGSGKSTLAKALAATAAEKRIKCRYVYGGFTSSFTILRPLVELTRALLFRGDRHYEESQTKGRALRNRRLSTIYQYLALADYVVQIWFRVRLPLAMGWSVVCDRYIYDLAASIGVLLDYGVDRTLSLLHRCLAVVPRPHLVFLLDLPEGLAYERKDDIVSLDFLTVRRKIYLAMARQHEFTILDAASSNEELQELVATRVFSTLAGDV